LRPAFLSHSTKSLPLAQPVLMKCDKLNLIRQAAVRISLCLLAYSSLGIAKLVPVTISAAFMVLEVCLADTRGP